jgi:phosphate acetyltransferase
MLDFRKKTLDIVKNSPRRLVLPEGQDLRVLQAAELIVKEKFTTELVVLGNPDELAKLAKSNGVNLAGVTLFDPKTSPKLEEYAETFYQSRKSKGMTKEEALSTIADEVYYAAMMMNKGDSDAMVSGSLTPTAKTVRASLLCVRPKEGIKTVSGSFVITVPDCKYGADGAFVYADCGVVPEPTTEQLADIAVASAESCRKLLGEEPYVAFLCFSTKGSADSPSVRRMQEAVKILESRKPDFAFDGEMQFDAAVEPSVAKSKAPGSPVAGRANVMIFPDLNAGNIAYKVSQRLAKGDAYGPLLQGLSKPVNDLSRGCSPDDILVVSAITIAQSL